ncbi:hypothetical protein FD754_018519, partial [Muntiacus muntjak]
HQQSERPPQRQTGFDNDQSLSGSALPIANCLTFSKWFYLGGASLVAQRKWQPTPIFLPGESHGRRSLVGYSPRGHQESDMTERLHFIWGTRGSLNFFFICKIWIW